MRGKNGSGLTCWFDDAATTALSVEILGSLPMWIDETWQIPFRIQALGTTTSDTQEVLDQRAVELLGEAIYVLVSDPDLDISVTDPAVQVFSAIPVGTSTWAGGILPPNMNAARFELNIELHARLHLQG